MSKTLVTLVKEIQDLYEGLGTWDAVGKHYDVHRSVVWRIANDGYEPKDNQIRFMLGLPQIIQQEAFRDALGRFTKQPSEQ